MCYGPTTEQAKLEGADDKFGDRVAPMSGRLMLVNVVHSQTQNYPDLEQRFRTLEQTNVGISGSGSPIQLLAAVVVAVADPDGISKANGSQKLISERDFCLGAPLRLLLLLCRCVVVVGRRSPWSVRVLLASSLS